MAQAEEPKVVYHYTTMDAMMNIVKTKSIWATSILYLNDLSEMRYLISRVRKRRAAYKKTHPDVDARLFDGLFEKQNKNFMHYPFVTSFSRDGDSLSQWRSYCPNGNGVAIGFSVDCLHRATTDKSSVGRLKNTTFHTVGYLDDDDSEYLDNIIAKEIAVANDWAGSLQTWNAAQIFSIFIQVAACYHKHSSFSHEAEYRLVAPEPRNEHDLIEFRPTRSCLVPYVELHIPNRQNNSRDPTPDRKAKADPSQAGPSPSDCDFIERLIVGPTSNMDLSLQSVQVFLEKHKAHASVVPSNVPYRDW